MATREFFLENNQSLAELDFSVRLMEHLVVPTFVLDAECRVIIWNRACERLTGVPAAQLIGSREHWRAFYGEPRPCLADLIAQGRTEEIDQLYADYDHVKSDAVPAHGRRAENWCVMPQVGSRLYLSIDAGPIFDNSTAYGRSASSPSGGVAPKMSLRHPSKSLNAGFFDGHVEPLKGDRLYEDASLFYPGGSIFTGSGATAEASARYQVNQKID